MVVWQTSGDNLGKGHMLSLQDGSCSEQGIPMMVVVPASHLPHWSELRFTLRHHGSLEEGFETTLFSYDKRRLFYHQNSPFYSVLLPLRDPTLGDSSAAPGHGSVLGGLCLAVMQGFLSGQLAEVWIPRLSRPGWGDKDHSATILFEFENNPRG